MAAPSSTDRQIGAPPPPAGPAGGDSREPIAGGNIRAGLAFHDQLPVSRAGDPCEVSVAIEPRPDDSATRALRTNRDGAVEATREGRKAVEDFGEQHLSTPTCTP